VEQKEHSGWLVAAELRELRFAGEYKKHEAQP
jgi:hypothetical protein